MGIEKKKGSIIEAIEWVEICNDVNEKKRSG